MMIDGRGDCPFLPKVTSDRLLESTQYRIGIFFFKLNSFPVNRFPTNNIVGRLNGLSDLDDFGIQLMGNSSLLTGVAI
jgi:hypothetical protein